MLCEWCLTTRRSPPLPLCHDPVDCGQDRLDGRAVALVPANGRRTYSHPGRLALIDRDGMPNRPRRRHKLGKDAMRSRMMMWGRIDRPPSQLIHLHPQGSPAGFAEASGSAFATLSDAATKHTGRDTGARERCAGGYISVAGNGFRGAASGPS